MVNREKMKITWKRIILLALCVLLVGGVYVGYHVRRAWQLFSAEDQIAHTFYPVVEAVYEYAESRGKPPASLADLVPETLAAIPKCPVVDSVSYHVRADKATWRLSLRSSVCGLKRIYCWQSDHQYTDEEERSILGRYHGGWTVMKDTG